MGFHFSQTAMLRLAAFIIDALVVALVLILPATVISYALAWIGGTTKAIAWVWYGALLVLLLAILFRDAPRGRSLGKRILGLRLTTRSGTPCGPFCSFLRNLPLFIAPWNLLELYLVISGRRRTGDRIAGTNVVEE
ncbi:MAG TPA: RDD family protein [Thermoanaerobaculia bacterium]|nr:RDD family protein [Thermoanaerobaculia bacterium]